MHPQKAVILAAGRGTRMKDLTLECPKPMLPLDGQPLLAHIIGRMEQAGIREVIVVTGYRAEMVEGYFVQYPPKSAAISFVRQPKQDGTGSATKLARGFAGQDSFLFSYGDILVETEVYQGLFEAAAGAEVAIALNHTDDPYQGAAVYLEGDRIVRIVEKPPKGTSTTPWNNAGVYCFSPAIFDYLDRLELSPRGEYELTEAVHHMLEAGETVRGYCIEGFWRDVGRPEDLPAAEGYLRGQAGEPQD